MDQQELQQTTPQQIRWQAMDLLARREHSRRELQSKLARRYPESFALIEQVLEGLSADDLLSDQRFTEAYTAMRKRKGYGPGRIMMELKDKGVERDLIAVELGRPEHNWQELAYNVYQKKFQQSLPGPGASAKSSAGFAGLSVGEVAECGADVTGVSDFKSAAKLKARLMRFLQYRGFSQDQIQAAMDC